MLDPEMAKNTLDYKGLKKKIGLLKGHKAWVAFGYGICSFCTETL